MGNCCYKKQNVNDSYSESSIITFRNIYIKLNSKTYFAYKILKYLLIIYKIY